MWRGREVWALSATHGMPLEMVLPMMWDQFEALPTWAELLEAAGADGANRDRLLRRLHAIAGDYPPDIAAGVRAGLARLAPERALAGGL